jgi:hypothetical protein
MTSIKPGRPATASRWVCCHSRASASFRGLLVRPGDLAYCFHVFGRPPFSRQYTFHVENSRPVPPDVMRHTIQLDLFQQLPRCIEHSQFFVAACRKHGVPTDGSSKQYVFRALPLQLVVDPPNYYKNRICRLFIIDAKREAHQILRHYVMACPTSGMHAR